MSLNVSDVERWCKARNKRYELQEDSIFLVVKGSYENALYRMRVSENEEIDRLQAQIWFPESLKPIERVDELCEVLNKTFEPDAQLGFETGNFWAGRIFASDRVMRELGALVDVCDIALPLCLRVGELGAWSPELVELACTPQEWLARA